MTSGNSEDDRDAELGQLVEKIIARVRSGESLDLETAVREFPEFEHDLREIWGTLMVAHALAEDSKSASPSSSNIAQAAAETLGKDSGKDGVSSLFDVSLDSISPLDLPCQFGDYELLEELGRGGMGIVFRARQAHLDRSVAVKMLLRGRFASPQDKTRFLREAQAAAKLNHPGIVSVFDVGEVEDRMYFSMPVIEGETLAELLTRGALRPRDAARKVAAIARAVDHAHQHGILHRDLKPANIMIDDQSRIHVTDFGLARPVEGARSLTRTGAIVGTPAFMAPEQAAGNRGQVAATSDVYALGAILYNAITGQPPFEAGSPVDVILKVLEQDPDPPRSLSRRVPRDLEMITMRCLQKPTELRYGSAAELADDLEAFLAGEPVAAASGRMSHLVGQLFRETHHAPILENWGLLWIWTGFVLAGMAFISDALRWRGVTGWWRYHALWSIATLTWAFVFWTLRRQQGPVTFVERQIAHVWMGGAIMILILLPLEYSMGLNPFDTAPMLAITGGMVFMAKAGILSGTFYLQAIGMFLTSFAMARWPNVALSLFGIAAGLSFFIPGLKYYRMRRSRELIARQFDDGSGSG